MQNYCQLLFFLIFILSMAGSLTRPDYNSSYSLLSYFLLATYRGHATLATTLSTVRGENVVTLVADFFAILVQQKAEASRVIGIVLIVIEMALKVFMLVLLSVWRFRGDKTSQQDFRKI